MRRSNWWLAWAIVLVYASGALAQTVAVAQLSGTVLDDSGGTLPGVEVTATQVDTGLTRFVTTNENGGFVFTSLPVGPYKLTAKLQGFSSFEQTGIVLAVGDARSVNIKLAVGAISETVTVVADATLVETRNVAVTTVVEQEQIVSLPLNGRSALQLIVLSGAAVDNNNNGGPGNGGTFVSTRQYPNAVAISVAGGTGNSTMYLVDGGYNNDPQLNTGNAMPFPDALQEFSVESGVRNARYGMSTGATVNAITKSGTNLFHGNAFEFARHHAFNAIRYFDRAENGGPGRDDGLKRAQTGGTIGGPIIKDRLFFFGGSQITNVRIRPVAANQIVPTAEVRRGDFRRIMSAACRGGTARTLGAPFVDNQIDPALYHPISLKIMSMLPLPDPAQDPDGCGRIVVAIPNNNDEQQYIGRVDFQMTKNTRVFARVFYTDFLHAPSFNASQPNLLEAGGAGAGNGATMTTLASGVDYVVRSNLLSSTRFSYQSTSTLRLQNPGLPTWASLGVKTWIYTQGGGQDFLGGGTAGWGGTGQTGEFYATTPSISQDFDWNRGSHSVSFGGVWTRPNSNGDGRFQANGNMSFTGLITSGTNNATGGLNMADFVLGLPQTYRGGGSQLNNQTIHALGFYAGDVWNVSRGFTMNYGIRWEPFFGAVDQYGFANSFSRERFEKGIKSTVYPNAPAGMLFTGDPGMPSNGAHTNNKLAQFAPRVGVVWDPQGNNEQTIRAGIGHYYDSPKLWQYAHQMLNPPFGNTVDALAPATCPPPNRNGCPVSFTDPWRDTPGGDPQALFAHQGEPVVLPPSNVTFTQRGVYTSMPVDVDPMQVTQWNLSYQRQFLSRMLLDVTYMGNRTSNIWLGYEENPAIYIPGNCQAGQYGLTAPGPCSNNTTANLQARSLLTLLNPTQGAFYAVNGVAQAFTEGKGTYHGVKFSLNKRMANGWSANANYTYSQCVSEGEPSTDIGNIFPVPLSDPYSNPKPDVSTNKGPCSGDRPHNFNLSSVLVSSGAGHGFVKALTRDWQLGLIYQVRSGNPLTPTTTGNTALTGISVQRPMIVPGVDPNLDEHVWVNPRELQWFNMAAFAQNPAGVWGDVPRGYLRGPGFWNVDAAFSRNLNVAGRRLELRVEAFNLFDHVNWADPNVQLTNAQQGRVTATNGDPRIMQFAVKYNF